MLWLPTNSLYPIILKIELYQSIFLFHYIHLPGTTPPPIILRGVTTTIKYHSVTEFRAKSTPYTRSALNSPYLGSQSNLSPPRHQFTGTSTTPLNDIHHLHHHRPPLRQPQTHLNLVFYRGDLVTAHGLAALVST